MKVTLSREMPCGLRIAVESEGSHLVGVTVEDQLDGIEAAHLDRCSCDRFADALESQRELDDAAMHTRRRRLEFVPWPAGGGQEPSP